MAQRVTLRKRQPYNTTSNRRRVVKTPGGKLVVHHIKKLAVSIDEEQICVRDGVGSSSSIAGNIGTAVSEEGAMLAGRGRGRAGREIPRSFGARRRHSDNWADVTVSMKADTGFPMAGTLAIGGALELGRLLLLRRHLARQDGLAQEPVTDLCSPVCPKVR